MFVRSKLLWLLGIILVVAYLLTIMKITEHFRNNTNDNNKLEINKNNVAIPNDVSLEFGEKVTGKEINAGKIRYGGWDDGALNIVGAGSDNINRKVRVWDKLQVGPLEIQEDGCVGYGPTKQFKFCFQTDGNIVQYKDKKPIWATGVPS